MYKHQQHFYLSIIIDIYNPKSVIIDENKMVSKELFIILLLHVSIYSASEYRSGFRNRKENNHKNRETKEIEGKVKSPTRQEKRKLFEIIKQLQMFIKS